MLHYAWSKFSNNYCITTYILYKFRNEASERMGNVLVVIIILNVLEELQLTSYEVCREDVKCAGYKN